MHYYEGVHRSLYTEVDVICVTENIDGFGLWLKIQVIVGCVIKNINDCGLCG